MEKENTSEMLEILLGGGYPKPNKFRSLVKQIYDTRLLAKVFLLQGVPYVFKDKSMKYMVFKEQIAREFNVSSQDICIVGSARLGFKIDATNYGIPFDEKSDVDVVIISEPLFLKCVKEMFIVIEGMKPSLYDTQQMIEKENLVVNISSRDWLRVKEFARNFVFDNFKPSVLPDGNPLKKEIFDGIKSAEGLFLALEPPKFVSKIRGRIFRTWKAAEDYYANSLLKLKQGAITEEEIELEEIGEEKPEAGKEEEQSSFYLNTGMRY